jgi:hypothetical protein
VPRALEAAKTNVYALSAFTAGSDAIWSETGSPDRCSTNPSTFPPTLAV